MIGTFHQLDQATVDTTRSFFRFGMILSQAFGVTDYAGLQSSVLSATESDVQMSMVSGQWKETRVYVIANSLDGDATVTLRINGVDTAQVVTIPFGFTGEYVDSTTILNVDSDLIDWEIDTSAATAGSITFTSIVSENAS